MVKPDPEFIPHVALCPSQFWSAEAQPPLSGAERLSEQHTAVCTTLGVLVYRVPA